MTLAREYNVRSEGRDWTVWSGILRAIASRANPSMQPTTSTISTEIIPPKRFSISIICTLYPQSITSIPTPNATQCILYNRTAPLTSPQTSNAQTPNPQSLLHPTIPQSFPLPLLMLRIQRANNINMPLPTLTPLPPNTLYSISHSSLPFPPFHSPSPLPPSTLNSILRDPRK
jgi:hypothetical protein